MTWLDKLVKEHEELESPKNFWLWAGLSAISAVVKDNVYLDRGGAYKLYPNIYVIFHADSGMKKGPPIALAKELVRAVNNTRIISGRASVQGIMKKLSTAYTIPGGGVISKSVGFICASELSSALVEDAAALTILTDLYDRHYNPDEWESLLKSDTFQLKDPTVSLLGGINDAHSETFFQKKDIQGGFLARTFVISEKEEQTINSLAKRLTHPPNITELAEHLKQLSNLKGKFEDFWDEENKLTSVGRLYDEWYNDFRKDVKQMGVKDETGTLNRFGDSVLKIAMLLSLARSTSLKINHDDLEQAIEYGEKLIGNIRQTTMGRKGMSDSAQLKTLIIKELYLRETHQVSRVVLMKKLWYHYSNATEFDNIMNSFHEAGLINTVNHGNTIIYEMPDSQVKELKKFFEGKNK